MSSTRAAVKPALVIAVLGVVFGDIGTSPLYTMRECLSHLPANVDVATGTLGCLSLMFWALIVVVCAKYLFLVMRAENKGEGGIFALLALLHGGSGSGRRYQTGAIFLLILVGAALLYGDGIITPAITILGAAEGLTAISPRLNPYVIPVSLGTVIILFSWQSRGTMRIGRLFGPLMLGWFAVLGILGLRQIIIWPSVLKAIDPRYGLALLNHAPLEIAGLLGAVVLVFTGAEALYADMGHFGRKVIALGWYGAAFPGLVLNYFGQGAFVLSHPDAVSNYVGNPQFIVEHPNAVVNPFFALASSREGIVGLTILSFVAAAIASQALISGSYSLTRQAIQLGYFPRLRVTHTNAEVSGQIYVPFVNGMLAVGAIFTVIFFRSSSALSAAYGIAVTGTMVITTIAYFEVQRRVWRRVVWYAALICAPFLVIDLLFFGSNLHKIGEGGWFPLAIGAAVFAMMHTWKVGRSEIYARVYGGQVTDSELRDIALSRHLVRVRGTAIFMVGSPNASPITLLHHVKSNRCLHDTAILLSIVTRDVPVVGPESRLEVSEIGAGLWRVAAYYGYMESPDAAALVENLHRRQIVAKPDNVVYFFNREMIVRGGDSRMWEWQKSLYGLLSRNARPAKDYFRVPHSQIVELGLPIQL